MTFEPSAEVRRIRERLDHPVIDSDGHLIEFLPDVYEIMADVGGPTLVDRFRQVEDSGRTTIELGAEQRRTLGLARSAWWGLPTRNTLDRATAMLPGLLYDRLDEIGVDVAVLYPTYGLTCMGLEDDELRVGAARSFNRHYRDAYAPYADRLLPVAIIPMFTPDEALAELDHAVGELGMRTVMMTGLVPRPVADGITHRAARRWDTIGLDSPYDYDPVWRRCVELGVSPTFHSTGMGWGSRVSESNYVYNHIGNFAAAGEALARSLLLGGVPMRFPELRFAFLEGGVAWGVNLFADLVGHFEKRNRDAIGRYDPAALDVDALRGWFERYAADGTRSRLDRLPEHLHMLSEPGERPDTIDEFARSGIRSVDDIRHVFTEQYHFGCEADDPMNAFAFDVDRIPLGARVRGVFASDIGHWDVPDFTRVLPEAYELVEDGLLDSEDFRAFTFDNPLSLWAGTNPAFFDGTVVEQAAAERLAAAAR